MASLIVYIVSDSVGETGELVARAAASQFDAGKTLWKRFTHVTDVNSLREIAMAAASDHGLIVFTLASSTLRTAMMKLASAYDVSVVDVLGPPIRTIASSLGMASNEEVGGLRKLDERYFRRVEAMEFAVQYDDGKDPQGFKEDDVGILGVSRTSKAPVCMDLAHKNIKAANYPVVPETPIPDVIFEIPPKKIFGLTINPQNLNEIRTQRLITMGAAGAGTNYADPNRLLEELDFAKRLYRRIGCRVLDVTNKAIEETAGNILELLYKNN